MSLIDLQIDNYFINSEPITDKSNERFHLYPITYPTIWNEYKKQLSSFWKAEEIDLSQDFNDWNKLDPDKKHVIKMILAFFANTDGIVNLNISSKFMNEITINEAKIAYTFQMAMENIHQEVYTNLLDNLIKDNEEKEYLFDAIKTIPSIKKMTDWIFKWIESEVSIGIRIIAFACVEGIFFSSAFATIFWLKKYEGSGQLFMPGLMKSNEFISRDEGLHCNFACELFKLVVNKPPFPTVKRLINDSVEIAKNFNNESIKTKLIGLNSDLMNQYIEFVADRLIVSLGYEKIYRATNPFSFMDTIGMLQKTNFHESRPTEYQSAHNKMQNKDLTLLNDEDF